MSNQQEQFDSVMIDEVKAENKLYLSQPLSKSWFLRNIIPYNHHITYTTVYIWLVLSDEQMSKGWPYSLLNDEQMSNWLGVEHQPDIYIYICDFIHFKTQTYIHTYIHVYVNISNVSNISTIVGLFRETLGWLLIQKSHCCFINNGVHHVRTNRYHG